MTIETDICTALNDLVDGRVYPDVAPAGAATPYVTYQQVGGAPVNLLEGGPPVKRNGRFQLNVWAKSRAEASTLGRRVEDTILSLSTLSPASEGALAAAHEPETNLYGTMQDFSFWFDD